MASFFKKYGGLIFIGVALTILLLLPHIKEGFYATGTGLPPTGTSCPDGYTLFEVPVGSGTWKCYKNCETAGHVFYRTGKGQGYSTAAPDIKCGPPVPSEQTLVYGYTDGSTGNSDPDKLIYINGACPSEFTFDYGASVTSATSIQTNCYSICPSDKIPLQKAAGGIDIKDKSPPFNASWCSNRPIKPTNRAMGIINDTDYVARSTYMTTNNQSLYTTQLPLSNMVWADANDSKIAMPASNNNIQALILGTAEFNLPSLNYWYLDWAGQQLNWFPSTTISNPNPYYVASPPLSTHVGGSAYPGNPVHVDSSIRMTTPRVEYLFHAAGDSYKYITGQVELSDGVVRNMDLVERTTKPPTLNTSSGAITKMILTETESKEPTTGSATTSVPGVVTTPAPLTPPTTNTPPTTVPCKAAAGFYCPNETGNSETCPIGYYCKGGEKGAKTACDPVSACDKIGLSEQPAEGMPAWKIGAIVGGVVVVGGILFVVAK